MTQITKNHLAFVEHAKRVFEENSLFETLRHPEYGDLLALRHGADRDCVMVYELGPEVANFVQQMEPCPNPRKAVMKFAHDMEKQLKVNDHKRGWEDEHQNFLFNRIAHSLRKLDDAMKKVDRDKHEITILCANIANFAMMIADNEGEHL
jgi:hypothetical protein